MPWIKRTSMGVIGDLSRYSQFQAAEAMREAAVNPAAGGASTGMGLGMGMGMAQQMANAMTARQNAQQRQAPRSAAPPPLPRRRPAFMSPATARLPARSTWRRHCTAMVAQAVTLTRETPWSGARAWPAGRQASDPRSELSRPVQELRHPPIHSGA